MNIIKVPVAMMVFELYNKLPPYYKEAIDRMDVKGLTDLKLKIREVETSDIHKSI